MSIDLFGTVIECDCFIVFADELHFIVMTSPKIVELYQSNISLEGVSIIGSSGGMSVASTGFVMINNCIFSTNVMSLRLTSRHISTAIFDSVFGESSYGVRISRSEYVAIHGNQFTKHSQLALRMDQGQKVNISGNTFIENRLSAQLSFWYHTNLTFVGNKFENGTTKNVVCVHISVYDCHMTLEANVFTHLPGRALYISLHNARPNVLMIKGNTMSGISDTPIEIRNRYSTHIWIENNVFNSNNAIDKPAAIYLNIYGSLSGSISHNNFTENNGKTIIQLPVTSAAGVGDIGIDSNTFYKNVASLATIASEDVFPALHYNMFSNPQSRYDLHLTVGEEGFLNATYNWWGIATSEGVAGRIWDELGESGISHVQAEPFLTTPDISCTDMANCSGRGDSDESGTPDISCTGVANCSGRGECVRPDTCECHSGWTGSRCSQFSCEEVYGCQGKGECVGPTTCRCDDGWLPPDCTQTTCYNVNNCSGRGVCKAPDR